MVFLVVAACTSVDKPPPVTAAIDVGRFCRLVEPILGDRLANRSQLLTLDLGNLSPQQQRRYVQAVEAYKTDMARAGLFTDKPIVDLINELCGTRYESSTAIA